MPYTLDNLPDNIKKLSSKEQRQWRDIWNSAYARCMKGKGADKDKCEGAAFAQANGVVLKSKHSATAFADFSVTFNEWDQAYLDTLPDDHFLYIEPGGNRDTEGKTTPRSKRHLPFKDESGKLDIPHLRSAFSRNGQSIDLPGLSADAKDKLLLKAQGMIEKANTGQDEHYAGALASFALSDTPAEPLFESDGLVYRQGLVFRAGDYPDKAYAMTPDEIAAAVESFNSAVPLDLEHVPTLLDGQLGELVSVSCSEDNQELHGIVAIPKWLDDMLPERKVSATWDRQTKTLVGLALVRHPRVQDAALMAAFAEAKRHDTYEGQSAIQMVHDDAARKGAVCNPPANFVSKHESAGLQEVHDITVKHGARCAAIQNRNNVVEPYYFKEGEGGEQAQKEKRKVTGTSEQPNLMARFVAFLKGEGIENPEALLSSGAQQTTAQPAAASAPAQTQTATADTAQMSALQQRNASLEAQLATERISRIRDAAVAFADGLIKDSIIMPAERDAVMFEYEQAAKDDMVLGPAKFSVNTTGADGQATSTEVTRPRVDQMKERYALRPKHVLTTEMLGTRLTQVLMNVGETPKPGESPADDSEVKRLIALTATGKAIMSNNGTTH
jgi:hypothetical protein